MASLALAFDLLARDQASPAFRNVGNAAEKAGKQTSAFGSVTSKAMASAAGAIAGLAIGSIFTGFINDARESARIGRLTEQVIKTTGGAAHVTAQQVGELATAISNKSGVDDEAVQSASNLLLTFTRVRNEVGKGNDIFNQATQAAVDMAAVLGGDASDQAKMLGKALNDPVKGITALTRAGVSFTEQQKDQIRTLVESGNILEAQKIILGELGTEFGGAAEAAADPLDRLGVIAGNLGEDIGGLLLPAVEDFADFAADDLVPAIREAGDVLGGIVGAAGDVIGFFTDLPGPVQAGATALGAYVLLKNPISNALETIALKALYAKDAFTVAGGAAGVLKKAGSGLLGFFGGPLGLAITGVTVAVGFLAEAFDDTEDSTEQVTQGQLELRDALMASKGAIDANVRASAAKVLQDEGVLDTLEDLGIQTSLATDAILGNGEALGSVSADLQRAINAGTDFNGNQTDLAIASQKAYNALHDLAGQSDSSISSAQQLSAATAETGSAMATSASQTAEATVALDDWLKKLQGIAEGFVEPLDVYKDLLSQKQEAERESAEATAAATEDSSDSWEDYVTDVSVSLDEYAQTLEDQLDAQANWRDNLGIIAQEAGADVAQYLADMGTEGVDLVAQMANGTDEEVQRMADAIRRDIQQGGAEWTAEMGRQLDFMEAAGRLGAGATVAAMSRELGLGTNAVRRIAAQYGIELAGGVNPILSALGQGRIASINGQRVPGFWDGGYTGDGAKYQPAGLVHAGEFVFTKEQTAKAGRGSLEVYAKMLDGYAGGGFVSAASVPNPYSTAPYRLPISTAGDAAMRKEYEVVTAWLRENTGGVPGSGSLTGSWVSIWNAVKAAIPLARINSTYRPGDPGYHGLNKAIDFGYGSGPGGAGSAGLASINRFLFDNYGSGLAELIYDGRYDDRSDIKNGRPLTYSASTQAEHRNHVHAAVYDSGGVLPPGLTLAYNGTGRDEYVTKGVPEVRVFIGDRELTDIVRVEAGGVVSDAFTRSRNRTRYSR